MKTDYSENQEQLAWDRMSYAEKNRALYLRQKALLDLFLEKNAISREQHDRSLRDLTEKMGIDR